MKIACTTKNPTSLNYVAAAALTALIAATVAIALQAHFGDPKWLSHSLGKAHTWQVLAGADALLVASAILGMYVRSNKSQPALPTYKAEVRPTAGRLVRKWRKDPTDANKLGLFAVNHFPGTRFLGVCAFTDPECIASKREDKKIETIPFSKIENTLLLVNPKDGSSETWTLEDKGNNWALLSSEEVSVMIRTDTAFLIRPKKAKQK